MNENQIEQIRDWVQLHYLVKEAVTAIDELKNSRISMKGLIESATKQMGQRIRDKLLKLEKDLRASKIHVGVNDTGEELIEVWYVVEGQRDSHYIKRTILMEDMEKRLESLVKELADSQVFGGYKVPDIGGDPYK